MAEFFELRGEGDGDGFACIWAEEFSRVSHDDEECHLTDQPLITFRAHRASEDFLPTIHTHIVADNRRATIEDGKMTVADIQHVPYAHVVHGFLIATRQDLLVTAAEIDFHGPADGVATKHPAEVVQPVRSDAHGAHAVLIHTPVKHGCRHEATKFAATGGVEVVAVGIVQCGDSAYTCC